MHRALRWRHQMEIFSALLALCVGIHQSPVNSPHKGQWRGALMFSLICTWTNDWVNNRNAGDLRRHRAHYDVTVMLELEMVGQKWGTTCDCHISNRPVSQIPQRTCPISYSASFYNRNLCTFVRISLTKWWIICEMGQFLDISDSESTLSYHNNLPTSITWQRHRLTDNLSRHKRVGVFCCPTMKSTFMFYQSLFVTSALTWR